MGRPDAVWAPQNEVAVDRPLGSPFFLVGFLSVSREVPATILFLGLELGLALCFARAFVWCFDACGRPLEADIDSWAAVPISRSPSRATAVMARLPASTVPVALMRIAVVVRLCMEFLSVGDRSPHVAMARGHADDEAVDANRVAEEAVANAHAACGQH